MSVLWALTDRFFENVLRFEKGPNGTWVVTDYRTPVYGRAISPQDALKDYIVSLLDHCRLLEGKAK